MNLPTINGVLLLDKPAGRTSAAAIRSLQRVLRAEKIGHGGTLDPAATGLLMVLLGEATGFAQYLLGGDKQYQARIVFGRRSDTDDGDGELRDGGAVPSDLSERVQARLPDFIGEINQTAPIYSALKHQGKPLHYYARRQQAVPVKNRRVRIDAITLESADADSVTLTIRCGGGVYIRSLARDLGEALACGAYLAELRRTHSSRFAVDDALTPPQLEEMTKEACLERLLPVATIVEHFPMRSLDDESIAKLGGGCYLPSAEGEGDDGIYRIYAASGDFAGLAKQEDGILRPIKFLHWTRRPSEQYHTGTD